MAQNDPDSDRDQNGDWSRPRTSHPTLDDRTPTTTKQRIPWFFLLYCLIIGLIAGVVGYVFYFL